MVDLLVIEDEYPIKLFSFLAVRLNTCSNKVLQDSDEYEIASVGFDTEG